MGSSASKATRAAAKATRKYPTRVPPTGNVSENSTNVPKSSIGPTIHRKTQARSSRDEAIDLDSQDPDLAYRARLNQLGPVQPAPTLSHSSTFNMPPRVSQPYSPPDRREGAGAAFQPSASAPAQSIFPSPASNPTVTLLTARSRIAHEAEAEFDSLGRKDAPGRWFLDVVTIRQVLKMRDGLGEEEGVIEKRLGLRSGVVRRLGPKGVIKSVGG